ncbi:MAG: DUF4166 domain-containing protein [Xanthomonadales bacterium]|nr:DUF4166 domain-containing protein [Xanthomonadales bacterium]
MKHPAIFESIFGDAWNELPAVIRKHYANRPYSNDTVIVVGNLDVMCAGIFKLLSPLMKLMGQIPVNNEKNVPVRVHFQSDKNTEAYHFNRVFNFKNAKPYTFQSRMVHIKDNEVVEIMRFGFSWKMRYLWDGQKVVLKHRGYALHLFGYFIPLPLTFIIGKGYGEETAIDDNSFDMLTQITHPWWGKTHEYKGRFHVEKEL